MSRAYLSAYLVFCAVIGLAVWMLSYSLILQFVWEDGRILHMMTTSNPLAPIQQFLVYSSNRSLQRVAIAALVPAVAGITASVVFGLQRPSNPLGDAAFQDVAALRRGGWFRKDGQIFGRVGRHILRRKDDRHHLIVGPTRSGKGVGHVVPNALMFPGSMIVTDLKGEIFELTAGYRKSKGHHVFLFSPGAQKTHRWNPLDFVRTDRGSRTIDIQNIAAILIPEAEGSENAVWQGTAQQVIAGVISYVLESHHYRNRRNLGEVNSFFNAGVDVQMLMKLVKESEPALSKFTSDSFNAYIALNERAARSALLDIQKALAPFRNERVLAATAVTDMDMASLQRRPVTIYLAPNITDMTILRPLLTLFVQQVMDLLTRERRPGALPVYFLLDEFRQLKKMDEVLNKLPYVAGYNIKMAFIIQDLKNIDGIYGESARHSLLGNCGLQLVLGANDQATAEYASRALGKRTIRYQSESRTLELFALTRRTKVEQIRERDLLMPQEIRQLPEDKFVLLVEGQRPILATKLRYYMSEPYKSAVQSAGAIKVEIPEVDFAPVLSVPALAVAYSSDLASNIEVERIPAADGFAMAANKVEQKKTVARGIRKKTAVGQSIEKVTDVPARLKSSARRLKAATSAAISPKMSPGQRKSILAILSDTIPDPGDVDDCLS